MIKSLHDVCRIDADLILLPAMIQVPENSKAKRFLVTKISSVSMSTALEVVSLIGELMSKQILSCNMNPALILHSKNASIQ